VPARAGSGRVLRAVGVVLAARVGAAAVETLRRNLDPPVPLRSLRLLADRHERRAAGTQRQRSRPQRRPAAHALARTDRVDPRVRLGRGRQPGRLHEGAHGPAVASIDAPAGRAAAPLRRAGGSSGPAASASRRPTATSARSSSGATTLRCSCDTRVGAAAVAPRASSGSTTSPTPPPSRWPC
jgi:hypothetical protein